MRSRARSPAPAETLGDGGGRAVLRKLVKSNRDTLAAGPSDERRADAGARESRSSQALLPKTLGVEEIQAALEPVRDAVRGAKNDGQATGVAMKHLKAAGAAVTGQDVAQAVKALRS